ncbi:VWA domain-containing protein [Aggregatilineales bacterium SYSU G02658]
MIEFLNPAALSLMLLLPAFVVLFVVRESARQRALAQIGDQRLVQSLLRRVSVTGRRVRSTLWLLAVSMLILALARPVAGFTTEQVFPIGAEVILLIDVSLSMAAPDVAPDRLTRAVLDAQDLAQLLPGTAFGIVTFAGMALPFMPPTVDAGALALFLNSLQPDAVPIPGTSLAAALTTSIDAFDDNPATPAVIVLFTDAEDHEGLVDIATLALIEQNIPVFALGYGTEQGSTIPTVNPTTQLPEFKRDAGGNLVITRLRMDMLEDIALATGGLALRADQPDALTVIAERISTYQGDALMPQIITRPVEYFHVPLFIAALLLLGSLVQPTTLRAETV